MNEHAKKGQELEELAELLQTVVDRKRRTGQAEVTAEEQARHDALLAREDVRQQLRDRLDLTDIICQIADWGRVCVAAISAGDDSTEKLLSALREANIRPDLMWQNLGTRFVCVRNQDQARALRIIEEDAKEQGYWVTLFHDVNPDLRDTSQ
jgi:hypothetical protein